MQRRYSTLVLCVATVIAGRAAGNDFYVNTAIQKFNGETVRGPATIHVTGLNPLRYNFSISNTATYPAGPALTGLPFIPPIPSGKAQVNPPGSVPLAPGPPGPALPVGGGMALPGTASLFNSYIQGPDGLNSLETERISLVSLINQNIARLNGLATGIQSLAEAADQTLRAGSPSGPSDAAITTGILAPIGAFMPTLTSGIGLAWPYTTIDSLNGKLNILRNKLTVLPTASSDWASWSAIVGNLSAYNSAVIRVNELLSGVADLASSINTSFTNFTTVQQQLNSWRDRFNSILAEGPVAFKYKQTVTCSFAFDNTKETKLQLVSIDRFAAPGSQPSTQELVTVTCSSPFSVSGGVGFSTIDERDIVFVPSNKTDNTGFPEKVFGYQSHSAARPIPLLLLNVRIWEPKDWFSLHISGGAAVDVKNGEAGSDVEYVVGPSFAFRRSLFVTTGLHLGRTTTISKESGFNVGDVVPSGLAAPPLEKRWTPAFVVALTWKIK